MHIITSDSAIIPVPATGDGWLVVEKPCDMSVHNDPGNDLCSIIADHLNLDAGLRKRLGFDPEYGIHAPHRLDKDTSGVILLACRQDIFRFLSFQFEQHRIGKRYVALLHGRLENVGENGAWGLWQWPLSRDAGGRLMPQGSGPMMSCETRYRLLRHSPHYSLVECSPETGRKHQIRRHAKLAGHPVVGDKRYSTPRSLKFLRKNFGFDRLALHSMEITFQPSDQEETITVLSPGIPETILGLINLDESV